MAADAALHPGTHRSHARLLVVEDDESVSAFLRALLETEGYAVTVAESAEDARAELAALRPVCILLDLGLPGIGGMEFLSELRRGINYDGLILVISGLADEPTKVLALRSGADDYVTKPVGVAELLARVEALLRRYRPTPILPKLNVAGLDIDFGGRLVTFEGRRVPLTRKEFQILACLAAQRGTVRSPAEILTEAWGPQFVHYVQTLRIHIGHLRRKLAVVAPDREFIRTVPGVGYGITEPETREG